MSLQIGPKFTGLPRFDIAVCCRQRRWDSYRNFQRWPEILAPLASEGFTIAAVGQAESSFDFDFFHFRSWDYDPLPEAVVHLISTSRLFIGTDTGPSHLAALISPTVLVFRNETCPYKNYLQDVLTPVAKDRGILFQYVIDGWQRPGRVSQVAREFLALQ